MYLNARFPLAALAAASLLSAFGASAGDDKMQSMDADNNGAISATEHSAGARQIFDTMDADHDGRVTAAEIDALRASMSSGDAPKPQVSAADRIRMIDTDGDGVLTAAEHDAGAQAMFTKMDVNGDGSLSLAELQAGHAALMQKNPG